MRSSLDIALRIVIVEWLEEHGKEATPEQIEYMQRGVQFWFETTVGDSISTAYDVMKGESAQS